MVKKTNRTSKRITARPKPPVKVGKKSKRSPTTTPSVFGKFKTLVKKHPILTIVAVIGVVMVIYFGITQARIYQERQDFKEAEIVLDELASDIATSLGIDTKIVKEKFCSYRSVKFSDPGPPACSFSNYIYIPLDEINNNTINNIQQTIQANNIELENDLVNKYSTRVQYKNNSLSSSDLFIDGNGLECSISIYNVSNSSFEEKPNSARISLGCVSIDSLTEHFEVKD